MSPDFKDLLSAFNAAGVEYLVVGAHAMAAHGRVRATGDLDVWVRPAPENAKRVLKALASFGAPLFDLTVDDLLKADTIFQIGQPPLRIDVITGIDAVEFEDAWQSKYDARFAGLDVPVLSVRHLVQNKRAAARPKDLDDVAWLEKYKSP